MLNRNAIAGPFEGAVITPPVPGFNDPANLKLWSEGPRLAACFSELVEGLQFSAHKGKAGLHHVALGKKGYQQHDMLSLTAPDLDLLKAQAELVAAYADLRGDRGAEILSQMGLPVPFWAAVIGAQDHRRPKTYQLMALAFALANHVEMRFKQIFAVVRPVELSPQIQPMIPTPGHGAYPSGHATEAFTVATLLNALLRTARPGPAHETGHDATDVQLQRQAYRIAVNRTVAGVHYPVDSACGRVLGTLLGEFMVGRSAGRAFKEREFKGSHYSGPRGAARDFDLQDSIDNGDAGQQLGAAFTLPTGPLMAWLWNEAVKEWQ
ncbi:phosphatase PAP2 family protein [Hydrogenophaga sp.]|uniref:phosphatase PAP2 family protein n=1 Tax=Hydrogenophaga sp. TaxID=1904254 RepID=UPI00286D8D03|nr:phosphatase PAP2 family protein [Hydrogenophaga sp.]